MNYFAIGYSWIESGTRRTWATVGYGTSAEDALSRFRGQHPHVLESWIVL